MLGLAALTLEATSCGSRAPAITGLVVTVDLAGAPADQLELSVSTAAGVALPYTPRPAQAGAALGSPQSVSIYLADTLAGQNATCTVKALLGGQPTGATGSASTTLALHALVPLLVTLGAASDAGTTTDAATGDGSDGAGLKSLGQACKTENECESTLCVDGVCCASACAGTCEDCDLVGTEGTCTPLTAGTIAMECAKQPSTSCGFDGTCDGNSGCRRYPAGVACQPDSCQGATYMPASACDGQGTCMAASLVDCTPYVCDTTGGAPACRSDCRADAGADCVSPAVCVSGSCGQRPTKMNGVGCVEAADCASSNCVDGVCCATACTGACQSCNQVGFAGTCRAVPAGKIDPHGICKDTGAAGCGTNGTCNGASACALYPSGTTCAAGMCNNRMLHQSKHCDGKGVCQPSPDVDCVPYRCDPTTTACFTSCTLTLQCAAGAGHVCVEHKCF